MFNFVQVLSDSVKNGQYFQIAGISKTKAQTITILFSTGRTQTSDYVLKIDVDFNKSKIIINESSENEIPTGSGEEFEFIVSVDNDYFQINFNDNNLCEYQTQAYADEITSVIIYGDLERLLKVNHFNKEYPKTTNDCPNLALECFIPIKYQPGHVIVISGQCTEEFHVDFPESHKIRKLIHFNVRFREKSVVMNTEDKNEDNSWSPFEDRPKAFPFAINKPFKIAFAFTDEILKVAVDGTKIMDFSLFRILLQDDENIWDMLYGFRITNRKKDTITKITNVEHIKMDPQCKGFEKYSSKN
ncbi:32 kDa beta-galactoside-binding lectin-like [Chironomus tepperi]|uniref:32 kDa beta-galactoside-binding lectin-like n=1 Tax=Chironomus tepperi TaxID=113505 RepID=UPI00391F4A19